MPYTIRNVPLLSQLEGSAIAVIAAPPAPAPISTTFTLSISLAFLGVMMQGNVIIDGIGTLGTGKNLATRPTYYVHAATWTHTLV